MHTTLNVPPYLWGLVAVLALVWLRTLLPDRMFRRSSGNAASSPWMEFKPTAALHPSNPSPTAAEPAAAPAAAAPEPAPAPAPAQPAREWSLEFLRTLDSARLEQLIVGFWQARSCTVEFSGTGLMISRPSTNRLFAIAQCRPFGAGKVGVGQLGELWETVQQRQSPLGLYYALSGFTPEALAYVKEKRLKLIMGSDLLSEIGALTPEQKQALIALL